MTDLYKSLLFFKLSEHLHNIVTCTMASMAVILAVTAAAATAAAVGMLPGPVGASDACGGVTA